MRAANALAPFIAVALLVAPLDARQRSPAADPEAYGAAMELVVLGDTAAAIEQLRLAVQQAPNHGPSHLRLGSLLVATASEMNRVYEQRVEAMQLLERAYRIMGDEPEVLLEYGLLLHRQHMLRDARRVLERAWRAAEQRGRELPPDELARFHYFLARIYETWWEDFQSLVRGTPQARFGEITCAALPELPPPGPPPPPHLDPSIMCPREFRWHDAPLGNLEDLRHYARDRMIDHYRAVVRADFGHVDASIRLLRHLADLEAWEEYHRVADRLAVHAPDDPYANLFLGLGLYQRGQLGLAESTFEQAIAMLPADERAVFKSVRDLLPRNVAGRYEGLDENARHDAARVFLTMNQPLYLAEGNERRIEHFARVAWADLRFSAPRSELRGWDTDQGLIWIRYGKPWREFQWTQTDELRGGRVITWIYGPMGPRFDFQRQLTYRRAWHTEASRALEDGLRGYMPEFFQSRLVPQIFALPHQIVRFRGSRADLVRLEVYGLAPGDSLGVPDEEVLETGFFLFSPDVRPAWENRDQAIVVDGGAWLTYRIELPAGRFPYSIEARIEGPDSVPRPAARSRDFLETETFADRFALSDLLLATAVVPRTDGPVRDRRALEIAPSRDLVFDPGQTLHIYFEVYGLTTDDAGAGAYRAELVVERDDEPHVVARVLRGAQELVRGRVDDPALRWERTLEVEDGIGADYLSIDPGELRPGEYRVRIVLADLATGETAERRRAFRIRERE